MKIACYSLVLGKGYTIPAVIETLSRLGYDGVEWRVRDDFHLPLLNLAEKTGEVKTLCDQAGLEIPALATYLSVGETEAIAGVLQAAAGIGISAVRLLVPRFDGSRPYDRLLEETRRNLAELEPICRQTKVKAALELHLGYIIPSASAARRLLEGFSPEWVGAIYDPGNMVCEGMENWKMGIQILGPYLTHVHVKNAAWYFSPEQGWQSAWAPLDEGIVYWGEVIKYLREAGYDGWLSVEDLREAPPEELLTQDLGFLRGLLEENGPGGS